MGVAHVAGVACSQTVETLDGFCQLDEAGYRQVIEDARGMGLDRMTELYQAAYDNYLAG